MRWNCPHCNTALTAPEDKLSEGWSFCRCFRCRGFSLIRKSDVGLIKVNGTPEHISAELRAERRIASSERAAIQRAVARQQPRQVTPPPFAAHELVALPDPLPEKPVRNLAYLSYRALPLAIALAGISAFGSAIYLFFQSQALIERQAQVETVQKQAYIPQPELPKPVNETTSPKAQPQARPQAQPTTIVARTEVVDEVTHSAMAPTRPTLPTQKALIVQPIHDHATLRTGPGLEFPVLGIANQKAHYQVSDFSDRWFKVVDQPGTTGAWIRNDLIKIISE